MCLSIWRIHVIHPQEGDITNLLPVICASFDTLDCSAGIIIRSRGTEVQDEDEQVIDNLGKIKIRQFSLNSNYAASLVEFLRELDLKWSQFKDTLNKLQDRQNEAKQRNTSQLHELADIFNSRNLYPSDYKSNIEDILKPVSISSLTCISS